MEKEGPSCDSDTSEELPDLFEKIIFDVENLKRNEIVWAAHKDLYWPSLVRSVDKKNKKVRVWYLDIPGKCFKIPFKKIHEFTDVEFSVAARNKAKSYPLAKKHDEVFRRSAVFIFRRSSGYVDNPADFFDTSKSYLVMEHYAALNSESKLSSENASTERVGGNNDNLEESSEGESLPESDEESRPISNFLPELYVEDSPYDEEMVDKILSCIKAGRVDEHLMDVLNSKIVSKRHDLFVEATKTCNIEMLSNSPSYIPISNHEKLHNVSIYLFGLYERKIGKGKPRMTEYVVSVWLPEAVDKAISLIEADPSQQPIDSSNSPLEAETLNITIDLSSDESSCSPIVVESSELPIDCGSKVSTLPTEVKALEAELPELPIECGYKGGKRAGFRRRKIQALNAEAIKLEAKVEKGGCLVRRSGSSLLHSELLDDSTSTNVSSAPKILSSSVENNKKKLAGRKKRRRRVKNLTSPKKLAVPKMDKPDEENLVTSTLTANASDSDQSG